MSNRGAALKRRISLHILKFFKTVEISRKPIFHEILCITTQLYLLQNFCNTHTHTHFPELVKSCSGHPKTCKSTKNQMLKFLTKTILSSIYTEESNKKKTPGRYI